MATAPEGSSPPVATVHKATRRHDGSGAVEWGAEITMEQAAEQRRKGLDIVVRGTTWPRTASWPGLLSRWSGRQAACSSRTARRGRGPYLSFTSIPVRPSGTPFMKRPGSKLERKNTKPGGGHGVLHA